MVFLSLTVNWAGVLLSQPTGQPRVTVPFSPYFLSRLQAGRVKSILSTDDAIQGTFTTSLRYPPTNNAATPTTLFSTQAPSFWDNTELTALLRENRGQPSIYEHGPVPIG